MHTFHIYTVKIKQMRINPSWLVYNDRIRIYRDIYFEIFFILNKIPHINNYKIVR